MGLWKTVRREVTGAWRSARYDVDRHVGHHRDVKLQRAETAEIVVREIIWQRRPSPGRHHRSPDMPWAGRRPQTLQKLEPQNLQRTGAARPRRRAVATTGVALLVAGGAAGTYLAVAGSLAGVNPDPESPAQAAPQQQEAAPKESPVSASHTSPTQRTHRPAAPAPIKPADIRPVVPPAPTPTKSIEATPTPSSTPSSTPTASPSVSPTTTDDASPQFTGRHRGRHHGQTADGR